MEEKIPKFAQKPLSFDEGAEGKDLKKTYTLRDYSDQEIINIRKKDERKRQGIDKTPFTEKEKEFFRIIGEAGIE